MNIPEALGQVFSCSLLSSLIYCIRANTCGVYCVYIAEPKEFISKEEHPTHLIECFLIIGLQTAPLLGLLSSANGMTVSLETSCSRSSETVACYRYCLQ